MTVITIGIVISIMIAGIIIGPAYRGDLTAAS
ncbi:MAG: hypothetical protein A4E73_01611 [Syntrophaceae bacterium PtaU1.Bin231]|nr:MAG: hypothetical protein A4E73_01611 [Syntrophaceae bacterium PtaU1.Bin231]